MSNETYITKYRPITLDEVIGHKHVVTSIQGLLKDVKTLPHGFVFVSPPGLGKTSFSRIIAKHLNCDNHNILEVDAGIVTGVEAMRELLDGLKYTGFGNSPTRFIIMDEVQRLSNSAWDAILKTLEEPPPHVYFCFCTTEGNKLPDAIKNQRCHVYNLKPVEAKEIFNLLKLVKENEDLKLTDDCLEIISNECNGSPRQALSYLSQCRSCKDKKEVLELIESATENNEVVELIKALINKSHSSKIFLLLKNLKDQKLQPESVRIQIANYFTGCVLKSNEAKESIKFLKLLNNFYKPIYETTGWATLTLACGGVLFNE